MLKILKIDCSIETKDGDISGRYFPHCMKVSKGFLFDSQKHEKAPKNEVARSISNSIFSQFLNE
jgi:hypothetical protein